MNLHLFFLDLFFLKLSLYFGEVRVSSPSKSLNMANVKAETVEKWISGYPELFYDHFSDTIYCTRCESHVKTISKGNSKRHIEGAVHKGTFKKPQEEFYFDLIKFLILCNIPWSQMKNTAFKVFFKNICAVLVDVFVLMVKCPTNHS